MTHDDDDYDDLDEFEDDKPSKRKRTKEKETVSNETLPAVPTIDLESIATDVTQPKNDAIKTDTFLYNLLIARLMAELQRPLTTTGVLKVSETVSQMIEKRRQMMLLPTNVIEEAKGGGLGGGWGEDED